MSTPPSAPAPAPSDHRDGREEAAAVEAARREPVGFVLRGEVDGWVRFTAWASLVANMLLILTGGLVRLTGSGLGCPTWPMCTEESWTSTPEMGLHGIIEFGNRTLTGVLMIVAVLAFLAVVRMAGRHTSLFVLTLLLGLGIPLQAVVGGITVLTGLNPWVVGIHFVISSVMIALAAMLVNKTRRLSLEHVARAELRGQAPEQRGRIRLLAGALGVLAALIVYVGTLVTGTGPHAGDAGEVVRHTFDAVAITRLHAVPVYLVVALVLLGLLLGRRSWPMAVRRSLQLVGMVVILQALIGFYQYFNGLPILVVALHLIGSAIFVAVVAMAVEKAFHVTSETPVRAESELRDGPVTV
ncbi:heme A synthase [Kocuria palustris]|uniref:COX15/CtaA family protein n=1 Tax=Kocuria palustris TaxID=71999 RepID=UPI0011A579D1|nr:COX15/CtaA family protein [Kocuria palustris]